MTTTKIPDPLVVLRRAEQKHTGEEPGDLGHLADAVRAQIVGPLTAGGMPVVDDAEVQKLQAEKRRLDARVTELRSMVATRDGSIDRLKSTVEALKIEVVQLKTELDTARAQLRDAEALPHGGVELLQADNARLANDLAATQRDLANANATLDAIADEQAAAVHTCQWPVTEPGTEPGQCACGKPWPRGVDAEFEEVVPDVEPWDALFGQIRAEVAGRWSA
ncbi:hypothetical protein ACFWIW_10935 [Amycolatopsis sp. NPDC058340]|uniref:hypothetical protein n=1 Tax=Amycolatopsis sp. NPDC058340 TaxID=3346453 RepID=UPI0036674BBC